MTAAILALGWFAAACILVFAVAWGLMELHCWHNRRFVREAEAATQRLRRHHAGERLKAEYSHYIRMPHDRDLG